MERLVRYGIMQKYNKKEMMRLRNRERKREAAALCLLILLLVVSGLAVGIGSAYFSDTEMRKNEITVGNSELEIIEKFEPPEQVNPGDTIIKKVRIQNTGKSESFIRCRLFLDNEDILPYLKLKLDEISWAREKDGYYYFKKSLLPGELTSELLGQVEIAGDTPESLLEKGFVLNVYAESYQKGTFGKEAWQEAWRHFERNKKTVQEGGGV